MVIGRDAELALLEQALEAGKAVALVGTSGVGKTVLAHEVAARRDNSLVVDCYQASNDELAARVVRATQDGDQLQDLGTLLEGVELLVLDSWNAELSLERITGAYDGAILLTANSTVEGAQTLPLLPFEVPAAEVELDGSAVYELFVAEAEQIRLGAGRNLPKATVRQLLQQVGGHPLGVVLAAQHTSTVGADEVLELLAEGVELQDPTRTDRQRSLAVALQFSWDEMGADNQRLFYTANLLPQPVRVTLLAELSGLDASTALTSVRELTQRGALSPGARPRPAALWRDVVLKSFRASNPDEAAQIAARVVEQGFELSKGERPGVNTDAPSIWEAALELATDRTTGEYGRMVQQLLYWTHAFAKQRFQPDYLKEYVEDSGCWDAYNARSSFVRREREEHSRMLGWMLERAESDEQRAQCYLELAIASMIAVDNAQARAELAKSREYGGTFGATVLELALALADGDPDVQEILDDLESREPPSIAYAVAVAVYKTWAVPRERRLEQARHGLEVSTVEHPRSRVVSLRCLADVLEREVGEYAEAAEVRQTGLELSIQANDVLSINTLKLELDWGRACAEGIEPEMALIEPPTAIFREFHVRFTTLRTMAYCLGGKPEEARVLVQETDRSTAHVPPLRDLFEVVDAAIAIATGEPVAEGEFASLMSEAHGASSASVKAQLALFEKLAPLIRDSRWACRFMRSWLEKFASPLLRRLIALEDQDARVVTLHDCSAIRTDGAWQRLPEVSAAMMRVLAAGEPASFEQLQEAAWPGEVVDWDSLVNRVSVRVSQIRGLGLKPVLKKTSEGFLLDCSVFVEEPPR